ncbi:MAG: PilZ domain-containing protein [Deltaproteobacteria bacterium]|nr:MAG: PilZ domain-containing protein [Deltaproteobacteria bacterium]
MALRLRYLIDTPRHLLEHVHVVDGAGYFFFPAAASPTGVPVCLWLDFSATGQGALLRGWVWARPKGGLWLELPGAARTIGQMERSAPRLHLRIACEQLVLAEAEYRPAILCRLRDVSLDGARLAAMPADAGTVGARIRIALPEASAAGTQLEAFGRVIWVSAAEVGVRWNLNDGRSRDAVARLVEIADEEWLGARAAAHPRSCRCAAREPELRLA